MARIRALIALLLGSNWMHYQKTDVSAPLSLGSEPRPSAEMQRLIDRFRGNWAVRETFEVSASRQRGTRQGIASFRTGPGFSLIEDYKSGGSAGSLRFLALVWWDETAQVY